MWISYESNSTMNPKSTYMWIDFEKTIKDYFETIRKYGNYPLNSPVDDLWVILQWCHIGSRCEDIKIISIPPQDWLEFRIMQIDRWFSTISVEDRELFKTGFYKDQKQKCIDAFEFYENNVA